MFGSGGCTCWRGQLQPRGQMVRVRARAWILRTVAIRIWEIIILLAGKEGQQGRIRWRYSRTSWRNDVVVATLHLVIVRRWKRETVRRRKRGGGHTVAFAHACWRSRSVNWWLISSGRSNFGRNRDQVIAIVFEWMSFAVSLFTVWYAPCYPWKVSCVVEFRCNS